VDSWKWAILNLFERKNSETQVKCGAYTLAEPKAFLPVDIRRPGAKDQDDMVLAKEWNALNSGLLKQLFDRHYVLAERKAGESMWLVPPLISDAMSRVAYHREYIHIEFFTW